MKINTPATSTESPYIAKDIIRQLDKSKQHVIKGDQDRVYVIDGREGSGKSTLALQLAAHIDKEFSAEQVVFNADMFEKVIREIPRHRSIVFDEAFNGLSSKGALSKTNKTLVRLMMECRQRNLFLFIVLPSIFLLEKYVAIFRSQALFHVFAARGYINRRQYKVYNYTNKKMLYIHGKATMSYFKPKVSISHRFYGRLPPNVNKEDYLKYKLDSFKDIDKHEEGENPYIIQRDFWMRYSHKNCNLSLNDMVQEMSSTPYGLKKSQIHNIVRTSPLIHLPTSN